MKAQINGKDIRINQHLYYVIETNCGRRIVSGLKASGCKMDVVDIFDPSLQSLDSARQIYRMDDGHLPEHRPTTTNPREALDFLDNNKFAAVQII